MKHTCHALGCKNVCPPAHLMCLACWRRVPTDLQLEVYRTVKLRHKDCDNSWGPWWRAQARAIAHVAFLVDPRPEKRDAYLKRELAIADKLEHAR